MTVNKILLSAVYVLLVSAGVSKCQNQDTHNAEADLGTLKLVQLVFRHGDRVPEYPYPNDPFKDENIWKEGWAQLTNEGKRQEHQLGQYLRQRYGNYLNSAYVPNQVYVLSSDTDRTIMSAQLALAGMYPALNGSEWDSSINWDPIPLRTVFTEDDNIIRMKKVCPRYTQLHKDFLTNYPMMKKINEENKELYETLSENSGVNITTVDDIDSFYATLMVEEYKGLEIPEWGRSLKTDQHFQYLYNLSYQARTYTDDLKRLRAGVLLRYLVNNVNERVANASMKTKMFMLSAHDITLIDILNTLGVYDLHRPWYSSVFLLELHQDTPSGNFFVELYLRNDTSRQPYKLSMPGCGVRCPLEHFLNYSRPLIPDNWDEECELSIPGLWEGWSTFTYIIIGVGGLAAIIFIGGLCCIAMQKKRKNRFLRTEYQNFS